MSLVRPAAIAAASLIGLIGLVGLVGGFRPALPDGPVRASGERVELQRWTVAVQRVEHVDTTLSGTEMDPSVRVWLTITNTSDRTQTPLPERLVSVRVDGIELPAGRPGWGQLRDSSNFDPDVTVELAYDFAWTAGVRPAPEVAVVVRDERMAKNFVIADNWAVSRPAATIRLDCPDVRQRP
jgi:hypothetical protein